MNNEQFQNTVKKGDFFTHLGTIEYIFLGYNPCQFSSKKNSSTCRTCKGKILYSTVKVNKNNTRAVKIRCFRSFGKMMIKLVDNNFLREKDFKIEL